MDTNAADDRYREECLRQAQAWLVSLTSGHATRADGEAFRQWCEHSRVHAEAFAYTRRLWDDLGPAHAASLQWQGHPVPSNRREGKTHAVRMGRRAFLAAALTASAAAMVLARMPAGTLLGDDADIHTGTGEQRRVQPLPGVVVQMNTQTAIRLPHAGVSSNGLALLRGEAIVTVDPARSDAFLVTLRSGRVVAAAGAQISVRCLDGDYRVTCLKGSATLEVQGRELEVKPLQQIAFTDGSIAAPVAVNPAVAFAWRDRVLIYDNLPLADIVQDINRYRPGKIIITDAALASRRVHARFTLDQLADVATLIHDAYGAHVTPLAGGWVLLS